MTRLAAFVLLGILAPLPLVAQPATFDLVLTGGRVIDPESGLDAIRNVGVQGDTIAAISEAPLTGNRVIDATSLVVAPGFIDLHSHSPTPLGQQYQVRDGVTTALELEAGAYPVREFGVQIRNHSLVHYGASVGYGSIRLEVKNSLRRPHLITDSVQILGLSGLWTALRSLVSAPREVFEERASLDELAELRELLHAGLDEGGLGIGLPLDYISEAVDADELRMIFEVAGQRRVPVFIHLRRGINGDRAGLDEALALASETGAALHVCHVTHNAMRAIDSFLAEIRKARAEGLDVTTEILPYNAGSALISSAVFGRDWRTIFGIDYEDVEWAATGERFNEAMWNEYRRKYPEGQVIHHYLDEAWTRRALAEPGVMVVSDLLPMIDEQHKVAPHNGAFARVLGRYVREAEVISLSDALSRMTLLPARRLEKIAPAFARKGRVQVGADADLVLFDPDAVLDRATYQDPYQPSAGIVHVIVDGVLVVENESIVAGSAPGQELLAEPGTR